MSPLPPQRSVRASRLSLAIAIALGAMPLAVSTSAHAQDASSQPGSRVLAIDSGAGWDTRSAEAGWSQDQSYDGGGWNNHMTEAPTTSGAANAAPAGVYASERKGKNFGYTIGGLQANHAYVVRLHFVEQYFSSAGQRIFDVSLNGQQVLSNFDVFSSSGGRFHALAKDFQATTNANGQIRVQFAAHLDYAEVAGIEVFDPAGSQPGGLDQGSNNGMGIAVTGLDTTDKTDAQRESDLATVASMGAKYVRMDFPLATVVDAVTCKYNWTRVDNAMAAAERHNLKVLGVITTLPYRNHWTNSGDCPGSTDDWRGAPTTDTARQVFADYAGAAAAHFKGRVAAWEIWNEPNLIGFWNNPSAYDYAALLRKTYPAIKASDPNVMVVTGGLGGRTGVAADIPQADYVNSMYNAGAQGYFDAIGVHPYTDTQLGGLMIDAHQVRDIMDRHGDQNKQIWGTETGGATSGAWSIPESEQVPLAIKTFEHWRTQMPHHGPLFWYTLHDYNTPSLMEVRENHFGIIRYDGSRKPVFDALVQVSWGQ